MPATCCMSACLQYKPASVLARSRRQSTLTPHSRNSPARLATNTTRRVSHRERRKFSPGFTSAHEDEQKHSQESCHLERSREIPRSYPSVAPRDSPTPLGMTLMLCLPPKEKTQS